MLRSTVVCVILATALGSDDEAIGLCSDSCGTHHVRNGLCEDGGHGSVWPDCELGSDCTDCGVRMDPTPPASTASASSSADGPTPSPSSEASACSNSCHGHAHNGMCEDGGPGSVWPDCPFGSDCGDCGVRLDLHTAEPPTVVNQQHGTRADAFIASLNRDPEGGASWAAFVALTLVACLACSGLCAFVLLVRGREQKGGVVFAPRGGHARPAKRSYVDMEMSASEVVLPTPLEAEMAAESRH